MQFVLTLLCAAQMYVFFAVLLMMQEVQVTSLRLYWDKLRVTYCPQIAALFTLKRFEAILHCLPFANTETDKPRDANGDEIPTAKRTGDQKNWAIQAWCDMLQDAWVKAVALTQVTARTYVSMRKGPILRSCSRCEHVRRMHSFA